METIHFTTHINADTKKVWHTMLSDATYREWTSAFHEGSYYEGDWNEGSEIKFLGADENGKLGGMYSRIKESNKYANVSIEHLGVIKDSEIDTTSDEVKKWAPSFENYTFIDKGDGTTELKVDMQIVKEYKEMFEDMWPKALKKLKEACER
jgi:hypothetical protein